MDGGMRHSLSEGKRIPRQSALSQQTLTRRVIGCISRDNRSRSKRRVGTRGGKRAETNLFCFPRSARCRNKIHPDRESRVCPRKGSPQTKTIFSVSSHQGVHGSAPG